MILVFSGTKEGNAVIEKLVLQGEDVFASFSTDFGLETIGDLSKHKDDKCGRIITNNKKVGLTEISELIEKYNIDIIIDATHPFAVNISKNAMQAAATKGVKYIRFERQECPFCKKRNIYYSADFKESAELIENFYGNVLLTIGVNKLKEYGNIISDKNKEVYVKILPTAESIEKALKCGVNIKQIIAFYGFWSKDLLKAFINEKLIKTIVSKQSGFSGGEDEKIIAASETGCNLIIVKRPDIKYDNICCDLSKLLKMIRHSGKIAQE
ncbi:MAG: precorrin-6A reductase [Actinomycetota bacterium]|nr:precorrin-6A reductase [Actinomycetota bacterium]